MKSKKHILPLIVISQFFCTSLWFAGNGVMQNLVNTFDLEESALGNLTVAVQFGFISGTLIFALLSIADRFSPSKVFFISAILGAIFNLGLILDYQTEFSLISFRFFTGLFLAGIYPVGMKIATDYYQKGLGKALGFLVGALVLGTALPHLLKNILIDFSWKSVLISTSALATLGGFLMFFFIKDGPYREPSKKLDLSVCFKIFKIKKFKTAAFGYFGHMWELYAFWAFVPILLNIYQKTHNGVALNVPLLSFFIIAIGSLSCVFSGYISEFLGLKKTAITFLLLSGICCLISPFLFQVENQNIFIGFLFFWGLVVIADSPIFSTLVAQNAPIKEKGTALTIVNCIGFTITIISIEIINILKINSDSNFIFIILGIGPGLGLIALIKEKKLQ